jgi:hypothetical protein
MCHPSISHIANVKLIGIRFTVMYWVLPHVLSMHNMPILSISRCSNTLYIQYGCGMQSMGACSLNHDTATSYRLGHTPYSLRFTPTCTCNTAIRTHPYANPQHLKVLKHFAYIQYGHAMQSMGACSLNHDTATSYRYRLGHTPFFLRFTPTCTCNTT